MTDSANVPTSRASRLPAASSEAVRVTFFEDRAEVQRRAVCDVPSGVSIVLVSGVTVAIDDPSLVAGIKGDRARVIAARVVRRARTEPTGSKGELAATEALRDEARRGLADAEAALARARAEEARAIHMANLWTDTVRQVPRGTPEEPGAGVARWRAAFDRMQAFTLHALGSISTCEKALVDARAELQRAEARYALARVAQTRYEAVVEVQVEAREAHAVQIDLVYRTPCALWRPEHLCRLVKDGDDCAIHARTWATVWQNTGETWKDVTCRFSTARPAQSASAPLVTEDVLTLRKKSDYERGRVVVETRDQTVAVAGLQRGARAVEEMPGVEDGGEPLWLESLRPATIPSDGAPVRVDLAEAKVECAVDRVAYPERTEAVHVRATATLTAPVPLLAGPVTVVRGGEVMGRGRVGFVGRGEPFELGFGVDDGLRVRRHVEEKREVTSVIGTQKIQRSVKVYVSNLGGESKRLTVSERVPVSEIEDVKVSLAQTGGGKHDARDGFLRWEIDVPPRGTHEVSFTYRIEAGARVVLPF